MTTRPIALCLPLLLSVVACSSSTDVPVHTTSAVVTHAGTIDEDSVEEGTTAPDFVALAQDDRRIALSELRGRTVILFFFTKDETPLATREVVDFRDAARRLGDQGITIVGVSSDSPETHR